MTCVTKVKSLLKDKECSKQSGEHTVYELKGKPRLLLNPSFQNLEEFGKVFSFSEAMSDGYLGPKELLTMVPAE